MLVFNEGVPRAGKSYDAVKNHILPALKKGRPVYARLNGLDHAKIAEYLRLPEDRVRELLHVVETKDVVSTFACVTDPDSGQWRVPDHLKDALCVIDEVHEFYVKSRAPMAPVSEQFFALIGQNGGDVVIMTQWIARVHDAIRARIERKATFQKLTAVGMKGRYRVTHYHSVGPMKFEQVGGKTEKYDPAIYPLYHGYAQGADNTEVYEEGGTNVWRAMALKGALFLAAGLVGAYFFVSFFTGGAAGMVEGSAAYGGAPSASPDVSVVLPPVLQSPPAVAAPVAATSALDALSPTQRYVADLAAKARPRLAARMEFDGAEVGIVEWIDSSNNEVESLNFRQIAQMGYRIASNNFGAVLTAVNHTIVVTQWPREPKRRESEARLYRLDGEGSAIASGASERAAFAGPYSSGAGRSSRDWDQVTRYGGFRGEQSDIDY